MDEIVKTCKMRTDLSLVGMWRLRHVYVQALAYADDIILIADSPAKLQKAVMEWSEILRERGMRVNLSKSQVMMVTRTDEQVEPLNIMCMGQRLEQVENYSYLGTTVNQTGKLQTEIRNRVQKTTAAYFSICNTLFGKREVEQKTKTRVQQAILEPILLYGSESWTPTTSDLSKINATQMKCLRRIAGHTRWDRIRNDRIRQDLNAEPIERRLENKQLLWFGHVQRMNESRITRRLAEARPQGRRPIGRPRTTLEERIGQLAERRGKTMAELKALATDRAEYKKWVRGGPLTLQRRH